VNLRDVAKFNFTALFWLGANRRTVPELANLPFRKMLIGALLLLPCLPAPATESHSVEYVFGRSAFPASNHGVVLAVGDFNGDGRLDLVSLNFGQQSLAILLGQPNGGFAETPPTITFLEPVIAAVTGDFNGDGKLDLAIARPSQVTVLLGNGDGTFGTPRSFPINGFPVSMIARDFNRDA